jgi:transposase
MVNQDVCFLPMIVSGGREMIRHELWHEIHSRFRLKESKKSIARSVGVSVQTVRKILQEDKPRSYKRSRQHGSVLTAHESFIRQRLAAVGYCARSIYEELVEQGYQGSYDTVKLFVKPLRQEAQAAATVRFETPPGKQGQVDWGQCWTVLAGKRFKVHLFVMTLGYSRRMFAKGTWNEQLPTFLRSHEEAFDHFGGVTHEIIYDNPKTVVLARDLEGRQVKWNSTFWDFSRYYGFRAWAHRPYRAQTKGKVESGVKYVKRFLRGKAFESLEHLNESLANWIAKVADNRIHGTTHRKPAEVFAEEQDLLISHIGKPRYHIQERAVRYVARDCMVTFETNRYSVPRRFVGKLVEVQTDQARVLIYYQDQLVVSHARCQGKYQNQIKKEHYFGIFYGEDLPSVSMLHFDHGPLIQQDVQVRDLAFYQELVEGGAQ